MAEYEKEKVFYDVFIVHGDKDADVRNLVLTLTGTITNANVVETKFGPRVSVKFESIIGDKTAEKLFGREILCPDHKVTFKFMLSEYASADFVQHPPKWGQYNIAMVNSCEVSSFSRKTGETVREVSCRCDGLKSVGSAKNKDGTDRKPVRVFGAEKLQNPSGPNKTAPQPAKPAVPFWADDIEEDAQLPF